MRRRKGGPPRPSGNGDQLAFTGELVERARRLFVQGAISSFNQLEEITGIPSNQLWSFADEGGWLQERDAYLRDERERVYKATQEAKARAIADCVKLAWGATNLAYGILVKDLQRRKEILDRGGELKRSEVPKGNECAKLAGAAAILSDQDSASGGDEATRKLDAMTDLEVAQELIRQCQEQLGVEIPNLGAN